VGVELERGFAGERGRSGKKYRQSFVENAAVGIPEAPQGGDAGGRQAAEKGCPKRAVSAPEIRMIPIAPRPAAVAMATMVSGVLGGVIATSSASLVDPGAPLERRLRLGSRLRTAAFPPRPAPPD